MAGVVSARHRQRSVGERVHRHQAGLGDGDDQPLASGDEYGAAGTQEVGEDTGGRLGAGDDLGRLGGHPHHGQPLGHLIGGPGRVVGDVGAAHPLLLGGPDRVGGVRDHVIPDIDDAVEVEEPDVIGLGERGGRSRAGVTRASFPAGQRRPGLAKSLGVMPVVGTHGHREGERLERLAELPEPAERHAETIAGVVVDRVGDGQRLEHVPGTGEVP